jgi:hypothetical protein
MVKAWIARRYARYTSDGRFWLTIGFAVLTVDMAIGYLAGTAVGTFWHGVGYAALAAGFAFLPDAAYEEFEGGRYIAAGCFALLCLPIGIKAYEQQLTYSAGVRHGEMQLTSVVNQRFDGAQDDVKRNRDELALLQTVLAKLQADSPWATTAKADGLKRQLADLNDRVNKEEKGQRGRKAGKGKEFERLQDEANEVAKRIATVEKADETQKRIEFLQAAIDKKRTVANNSEHRQSINVDVAKTTAKLFNVMRGQSAEDAMKTDSISVEYATMGSASLGSLALLLLAPASFFLAGRRRIKTAIESMTPPSMLSASHTSTHSPSTASPHTQTVPTIINKTQVVDDKRALNLEARIEALCNRIGPATAQYRTAA